MAKKIAAGNWKMNGTQDALSELKAIEAGLPQNAPEVVICPPATLLLPAVDAVQRLKIGAQDCHAAAKGAHTGDISALMITDAGASHVILGHSERRQDHDESDSDIHAKVEAAWAAGLTVILCIGESEADREAGNTLDVIADQLAGSLPDDADADNTVIAYEPIWAIGTGKVPSLEQIAEVHDFLRQSLNDRFGARAGDSISLLYGGSVKPDNAAEIFRVSNVDGALVGGASLKADDFGPIVSALAEA